jgi:hypothetical protein
LDDHLLPMRFENWRHLCGGEKATVGKIEAVIRIGRHATLRRSGSICSELAMFGFSVALLPDPFLGVLKAEGCGWSYTAATLA